MPLRGDTEHTLAKEAPFTTISPLKDESCEVTINTETNEIGTEFEHQKCTGSQINQIQQCLSKPMILISNE